MTPKKKIGALAFASSLALAALVALFPFQAPADTAASSVRISSLTAAATLDDRRYVKEFLYRSLVQAVFSKSYVYPMAELWSSSSQKERADFKQNYPWLFEFLYREQGTPRYLAVNKWAAPISISLGYPNNLKPHFSEPPPLPSNCFDNFCSTKGSRFLLDDEAAPSGAENGAARQAVVEEVQSLLSKLSDLTQLPVTYKETTDKSDTGGIRIILVKNADKWETKFKRGVNWSDLRFPDSYQFDSFRKKLETRAYTAVPFTPHSKEQVDGYFFSNQQNEINLSFCYIWQDHPAGVIKALTRECIIRSLGLPNFLTTSSADMELLLGTWGARYKETRLPSFTEFDAAMVSLLYSPEVKTGMSPTELMTMTMRY